MKIKLFVSKLSLFTLMCLLLCACMASSHSHSYQPGKNVMATDLALSIKNFIDATNRHDTHAFITQFTPDAELTDWGHHYIGKQGLLDWNATDNIGVNARMEFVSAKAISRDGLTGQAVTVKVKSRHFNGTGLIQFYLQDGQIHRIFIEP